MQREFRKFRFSKLVRDNIAKFISESGGIPHCKVLSKKEYIIELQKKVFEEATELPMVDKKKNILEEVSDVQEVIDNLIIALDSSRSEIKELQKIKNKKRGSFKKRIFIEYVDAKEDSAWVKYYLKNPDKYPEIKD